MTVYELKRNYALFYYGKGNSGKSTVLNLVIEILRRNSLAYFGLRKQRDSSDCRAVLLYRGFLVAIGTYGDSAQEIDDNFDFFTNVQSTIVVTASRNSAPHKSFLTKTINYITNATVCNVPKNKNGSNYVQDMKDAIEIIKKIDDLISAPRANRYKRNVNYPLFV